ncbi:RDD family protein [Nostocoides sp. Soil756]|uniref:RDD family protein n=1 Tax=Nostocoides sp. Soil756 TaxID=1736399 RepID=UPI0006FC188D|nr:RDD family protein [Tetrasphaera sp. Soil756]KRE62175.1 transporter [Tetrasphaera sp. Soil756]
MSDNGAQGPGYRAYASEDVVTGEGVAIELPVASTMVRAVSGLIDLVVAVVLLVAVVWGVGVLVAETSDAVATAMQLVGVVVVTVGLPATVETLTRGRTLGKLVMGLRVVRDDGGPITSRHAITRALVGFVEIYVLSGIPSLVTSVVNPRCKRLGDLAAGTYVVTQRSRMRLTAPPQMPAPLAAWAHTADVAALPSGLTVAVRQFLSRAGALSPASREPLGAELLVEVLRYVAPAPPPGYHGEYVLAAVIAERRRRDADRLAREQALRDRVVGADPLR